MGWAVGGHSSAVSSRVRSRSHVQLFVHTLVVHKLPLDSLASIHACGAGAPVPVRRCALLCFALPNASQHAHSPFGQRSGSTEHDTISAVH